MLPSDSPFPCHWWGTSLENAGLGDVRPDVGTYGRYEFDCLPPIPFEMRGDFDWLISAPEHADHSIGEEKATENAEALPRLREASAHLEIKLPEAFTKFMESPALQRRVQSNTDCFLDLCSELVRLPTGGGYLVRFLADSQGCLFWYLYLTSDGLDHAVVSSPEFYGTEVEQWQDEPLNPAEIVYSAESFEAFICRFWLENEVWYSAWQRTPMPTIGREYIEHYRGDGA
ncbi:MAG: hypothetical protein H0T73_06705 [Ardenticatenales bacterium]|nr:hypothetical protein [Ardenticatenales bacterium]